MNAALEYLYSLDTHCNETRGLPTRRSSGVCPGCKRLSLPPAEEPAGLCEPCSRRQRNGLIADVVPFK